MIFVETKCSCCGEYPEDGHAYVSVLNEFYCLECARKIYPVTFLLKDHKETLDKQNKTH